MSADRQNTREMEHVVGCDRLLVFDEPTPVFEKLTGDIVTIDSIPVSRLCDEATDLKGIDASRYENADFLERCRGGAVVWAGPEIYYVPADAAWELLPRMSAGIADSGRATDQSSSPPGNTQTMFPYPGGKGDHVDWILEHLPEHRCYVEPFAGSASVLVNKDPSPSEVVNDKNEDVTTFFRVLRDHSDELTEWLHKVPYARSVYEDWADAWMDDERPDDEIEHAGRFYVLRQMQMMGKLNTVSGMKTGAKYPASRTFHNARQQLEQFAERFQEVTIENRDWANLIDSYDTDETLFYCDPPYMDQEDTYGFAFNQAKFARAISDIEGYCVISYTEIPPVFDLDDFHVVEKDTARRMGSQQRDVTERLLLNFDPGTNETFTDAQQTTLSDLA